MSHQSPFDVTLLGGLDFFFVFRVTVIGNNCSPGYGMWCHSPTRFSMKQS